MNRGKLNNEKGMRRGANFDSSIAKRTPLSDSAILKESVFILVSGNFKKVSEAKLEECPNLFYVLASRDEAKKYFNMQFRVRPNEVREYEGLAGAPDAWLKIFRIRDPFDAPVKIGVIIYSEFDNVAHDPYDRNSYIQKQVREGFFENADRYYVPVQVRQQMG